MPNQSPLILPRPTSPPKNEMRALRKAMHEMNAMTMAVMLSTRLAAIEAPRVAASSRLLGCPPSSLYKQSEREKSILNLILFL